MANLIPKHGGYRKLKSFQVAQLAYDVTVRFCELYIEKGSRTKDQMVQAARSGVQNIAEGSQASATSRKMELKLTQVARASLEELRLDYEDFLRQRGLVELEPGDEVLVRFKERRCRTLEEVQEWVKVEREMVRRHGRARTGVVLGLLGGEWGTVASEPCLLSTGSPGPTSCQRLRRKRRLHRTPLPNPHPKTKKTLSPSVPVRVSLSVRASPCPSVSPRNLPLQLSRPLQSLTSLRETRSRSLKREHLHLHNHQRWPELHWEQAVVAWFAQVVHCLPVQS